MKIIFLLLLFLFSANGLPDQLDILEERKKRIMRKYLRQQTTVHQSNTIISERNNDENLESIEESEQLQLVEENEYEPHMPTYSSENAQDIRAYNSYMNAYNQKDLLEEYVVESMQDSWFLGEASDNNNILQQEGNYWLQNDSLMQDNKDNREKDTFSRIENNYLFKKDADIETRKDIFGKTQDFYLPTKNNDENKRNIYTKNQTSFQKNYQEGSLYKPKELIEDERSYIQSRVSSSSSISNTPTYKKKEKQKVIIFKSKENFMENSFNDNYQLQDFLRKYN